MTGVQLRGVCFGGGVCRSWVTLVQMRGEYVVDLATCRQYVVIRRDSLSQVLYRYIHRNDIGSIPCVMRL